MSQLLCLYTLYLILSVNDHRTAETATSLTAFGPVPPILIFKGGLSHRLPVLFYLVHACQLFLFALILSAVIANYWWVPTKGPQVGDGSSHREAFLRTLVSETQGFISDEAKSRTNEQVSQCLRSLSSCSLCNISC